MSIQDEIGREKERETYDLVSSLVHNEDGACSGGRAQKPDLVSNGSNGAVVGECLIGDLVDALLRSEIEDVEGLALDQPDLVA